MTRSGRKAQGSWTKLRKVHPAVAAKYRYVDSLHTSGLGITNGSRQSKEAGMAKVANDLRAALGTAHVAS